MARFTLFAAVVALAACATLAHGRELLDNDDQIIDNGGDFICQNIIGTVNTVFPGSGAGALNKTYTVDGNKCMHFYRGWDVTGVVNEFDIVAGITHSCDCIRECVKRIGVCSAWVWKFTGDPSGNRTCTLYSQFNLPPQVTIAYNNASGSGSTLGTVTQTPMNNDQFGHIQAANLMQAGSLVPHCTNNDGSGFDSGCKSGSIFLLDSGTVIC